MARLSQFAQPVLSCLLFFGISPQSFAQIYTNTISGTVYNDLHATGVVTGNPGLAGWSVDLFDFSNNLIATTTSDPAGAYAFADVTSGVYFVAEELQSGWLMTQPGSPGYYKFNLTYQQSVAGDFGNFQLPALAGVIFNDGNGNASRDPGETGLAGWTVNLFDHPTSQLLATTLTAADGSYSFAAVLPGEYDVAQVVMPGWTQTLPTSKGVYDIPVVSGGSYATLDFGDMSAVPEPSTWAMMLLGFGGLGALGNRRRRMGPIAGWDHGETLPKLQFQSFAPPPK